MSAKFEPSEADQSRIASSPPSAGVLLMFPNGADHSDGSALRALLSAITESLAAAVAGQSNPALAADTYRIIVLPR